MRNKFIEIIVTSFIVILFTFLPFHPWQRNYKLQYRPELRSYITWDIYVGKGDKFGREDDIIAVPLNICNRSYGLAKDIILTIIYDDGTNKAREYSQIIPVLEGGQTTDLPIFAPSILSNAKEIYLSGKKIFKMKVLLNWQDVSGKKYNSVELFRLAATEGYSDYPSKFVVISKGFYNNIQNSKSKKGLKKYSNKKIDF